MNSTSATKILWQFSSIMDQMEELKEEDSGAALDVLSIMTNRLLRLSQSMERLFVTEGVTSKEILSP